MYLKSCACCEKFSNDVLMKFINIYNEETIFIQYETKQLGGDKAFADSAAISTPSLLAPYQSAANYVKIFIYYSNI